MNKYYFLITISLLMLNCSKNEKKVEEIIPINQEQSNTSYITDVDGNSYKTIQIGDQTWMAENLRVTHFNNGDTIYFTGNNNDWANTDTSAFCYYDNDILNSKKYGNLYNYSAAIDTRKIAPIGWHVPSHDEWVELLKNVTKFTLYQDSIELKKIADLNIIRSGFRNCSGLIDGTEEFPSGTYNDLGKKAIFWTKTFGEFDNYKEEFSGALYIDINDISTSNNSTADINYGYSIRCIKDH